MQTLEKVSIQQDQLNHTQLLISSGDGTFNGKLTLIKKILILINLGSNFEKLNTDIGIIKSLLLNQNQFPPIPENFKRSAENEIISPLTQKIK